MGIRFISEIDRDVERASEAFELFEQDHHPAFGDGRFADVGVVRGVLNLTHDEFRELRRKSGQPHGVDFAKYQALLK